MKAKDKVIVVTGGGSGIGRQLVLQLLEKGARVAAADMRPETLEETAQIAATMGDRLSTHVLNVTDKKAVELLPEQVVAIHGHVDGVINNAGIIQPFVKVNDLDYEAIHRVMDVNFYGMLYMTKAFLPHLLERPEAHVVNLSSMGAFLPVPGQSLYGASKAAVKLLSEGLHAELMNTNVHVTIIFPGAVNTNISTNSGIKTPPGATSSSGQKIKTLSADEAASAIINGMESNKVRVYIGKDSSFMNFLYRVAPEYATRTIVKRMGALLER